MRLDFTGLKVDSLLIDGIVSSYTYKDGIIEKKLTGYNYGDTDIIIDWLFWES